MEAWLLSEVTNSSCGLSGLMAMVSLDWGPESLSVLTRVGVPTTVADKNVRASRFSTRAGDRTAPEVGRDFLRFMVRTPVGFRRRTLRPARRYLGARHRKHGFSRGMAGLANVGCFETQMTAARERPNGVPGPQTVALFRGADHSAGRCPSSLWRGSVLGWRSCNSRSSLT